VSFRDRLRRRIRAIFFKAAVDREMDDEMRLHLALESEALIRDGIDAEEAARRARVAFGNLESHQEDARDRRGVKLIDDLVRDARHTMRALKRSPGFAITTVVTLAIGIGATTLVFSAVNAIFVRDLAVRDPGRVFVVQERRKNGGYEGDDMALSVYSYDHFVDVAEATPSVFSGVAASAFGTFSVRQGPYAHDVSGVAASSNYFSVLGLQPALGRFFAKADERTANAPAEVVIGYALWQREYQGDASVLGRTVTIDGRPVSVVGVAPKGFDGTMIGVVADIWIPAGILRQPIAAAADSQPAKLRNFNVVIFGRLRPDLSLREARAKLAVIGPQLPTEHQPRGRQWVVGVRLDPISGVPAMMHRSVAAFMSMLMLTGVLVLLIAVANVAGMLLARGAYRRREIAVRLALGASRGRLLRQLLTESIVLCTLGACGGLLLAHWLLGLLPAALPPVPVKIAFGFTMDPVVLSVTLAVAIASGILAGLNPALQSLRTDLVKGLHGSAQGTPARVSRARDVFVVGQLALSLVLLITAGMFARALERATNIDPGFDARRVMTARIDLSDLGYTRERAQQFYADLLTRLRARPEIAAATLGVWTPLGVNYNGEGVYLPGEQPPNGKMMGLSFGVVEAGYLDVMRVPLVAGRSFTASDVVGTTPVIIVNESFARRYWPDETPLGRTVKISGAVREVVGVTRDGKYRSLDESPENYAFLPLAQQYNSSVNVFVRARGDSSEMPTIVRREVAALDRNVALDSPAPLASQIAVYLWPQQAAAAIVGAFGAIGLLLAVVGVYGIVSHHVGKRTREFGIRLALGAERATLVRMALSRSFTLIAVSVGIGAVLSLGVTTLARRFLFGLGAADPVTFSVVSLLLAIAAVAASYVPARRATKIDPAQALRTE
jgi:predicted permease